LRGDVRDEEADPRQLHVAGAETPSSPPRQGGARLIEKGPGVWAVIGGGSRFGEAGQDTRLVPEGGAPGARQSERRLQPPPGGGHVAGGARGAAKQGSGLALRERAPALTGERDSLAAVLEGAREVALKPEHLAQEPVRPVEGVQSRLRLGGEQVFQARPSLPD